LLEGCPRQLRIARCPHLSQPLPTQDVQLQVLTGYWSSPVVTTQWGRVRDSEDIEAL